MDIFWDFDGTLAHADALWSRGLYGALRLYAPHCRAGYDEVRNLTRTGFPWHDPDGDYTSWVGEAWWARMEELFLRQYARLGVKGEAARRCAAFVRRTVAQGRAYCLYADTLSTLEAFRAAGCRQHLLSNHCPELPRICRRLGLEGYLDTCTVSALEGYDKPRRELFEIALRRAGHPQDAWMVGDNPVADVLGGKRAGMRVCLVHKGPAAGADLCCAELGELPEALLCRTP